MARAGDGIATGRLRRATPLAGMAARATGEAVIRRLRRGAVDDPDAYARRAERYVELLGHSKGALMKAGQMLSFVPFGNAIPAENRQLFQAAMSRLQADAPPMAPELAAEVVAQELGAPPERVFASFDPLPFAAASIGQVHEARLHDGTRVAVKVQYPGVADAIRADLRNAELLAVFFQLLRSLVPGLTRVDPKAVAAEIAERVTEELDYRMEAAYQRKFAEAYRDHPFIRIPEVIDELSTGRVLTQQYADGRQWAAALQAPASLRDSWGEAIYRFAFGSLRRLGLFNADPHPGNYLFHDDGTVTFVDFGCVKQFAPEQTARMQQIVRAVIRQDADLLWRTFVELGIFEAGRGPTPAAILKWYSEPFVMLTGPQPFTITSDVVAAVIAAEFSPTGPSGDVVRALSSPPDYVFLARIDLGLFAVLGELRATGLWRAIEEEMDFDGAPATPMGEADAAFWAAKAGSPLAETSR
ncbi:MAG TPA: AarF/ABC1/UbiB kinase family protein [Mycobacteriales bacterium]|nr:AarF/ABC1/UbiB kinase family protein [Mycobacteriales bacterium]